MLSVTQCGGSPLDVEVHAGERRAGAVVGGLGVGRDVLDRARERLLDRLRGHGAGVDDAAQAVDRARAGDLAADVAAHAVGDDEERDTPRASRPG